MAIDPRQTHESAALQLQHGANCLPEILDKPSAAAPKAFDNAVCHCGQASCEAQRMVLDNEMQQALTLLSPFMDHRLFPQVCVVSRPSILESEATVLLPLEPDLLVTAAASDGNNIFGQTIMAIESRA